MRLSFEDSIRFSRLYVVFLWRLILLLPTVKLLVDGAGLLIIYGIVSHPQFRILMVRSGDIAEKILLAANLLLCKMSISLMLKLTWDLLPSKKELKDLLGSIKSPTTSNRSQLE